MLNFDSISMGERSELTQENLNKPIRDFDNRIHALEVQEADRGLELERLKAIGIDQITALFADAAGILSGFSTLGLVLTADSSSSATIALGEFTVIVDEADRSSVPTIGYVTMKPVGVDAFMSGFILSYNESTGELTFLASTISGSGTYSDWVIGLAASGAAPDPDSVPVAVQTYVTDAIAPVDARVTALEDIEALIYAGL